MGRKKGGKKVLEFYDVKAKRKFKTSNYRIVRKKVRGKTHTFAVAKSPYSKTESWRSLYRGKRKGKG